MRIGMWPDCRANQVKGGLHIRYPVANGFIDSIFQSTASAGDRAHVCSQQFHTKDIEGLALNIQLTHVNDTFQSEHRTDGGRGNPMLSSARLGNDALLAHTLCQQALSQCIVDFVCTSMGKVFTLKVDFDIRSNQLREARGIVEGGWTANEAMKLCLQFSLKPGVIYCLLVGIF